MELKFTPALCKDRPAENDEPARPALFKGTVTLRTPTYDEKMALSEIGLEDYGSGSEGVQNIRRMRALVKASEAHYLSVNIESVDGAKHYTTIGDIKDDMAMHPVLVEVATRLVNQRGFEGND